MNPEKIARLAAAKEKKNQLRLRVLNNGQTRGSIDDLE